MLFYIFLFIIIISLAFYADISSKPVWGLVGILFVLVVVVGFRDYGVGTDTLVYPEDYFNEASKSSIVELFDYIGEKDIGYLLLAHIASFLWDDRQSMLLLTELFIASFTIWGIYRLKCILGFSYCVYFALYCLIFLNPSMNYMRQNCAVSVLLIGFTYLLESRWKVFFLFQFLAFFFHSSSLLFLIVPFFYSLLNLSEKKRYLFTIVFFVLTIVAVMSFYQYLQILTIAGVVSETYGERYGETGIDATESLYGVSYIVYVFLNYIIIWYSYKNEALSEQNQYMALCLYTSSVVFYYTSSFVVFLSRLAIYFDYLVIIYLAVMLSAKSIPIYVKALLILVQMYTWVRLFVIAGSSETIPYTSAILGIS